MGKNYSMCFAVLENCLRSRPFLSDVEPPKTLANGMKTPFQFCVLSFIFIFMFRGPIWWHDESHKKGAQNEDTNEMKRLPWAEEKSIIKIFAPHCHIYDKYFSEKRRFPVLLMCVLVGCEAPAKNV